MNSNYLKLSLISGICGFGYFNYHYFCVKNNLYPLDYFILGPISFLTIGFMISAIVLISITIKDVVNTIYSIGIICIYLS